ncbi:Ig-like domain-containing protein [bacterium]|nr:Ig-like domain-containing protein [bacterium]
MTAKVIHFYIFSNSMRKLKLFFTIFVPLFINAQINESFTDGDFSEQPEWVGNTTNFIVNPQFQLQSNATTTSTSWLFTPSTAIDDAVWECSMTIKYTTSSSNYAAMYLISDVNDLTDGCNGYFVQVGGTNDEVSLYLQQGTKKTKIIDGADKRTDGNPVEIRIKVARDKDGKFTLFSKLNSETDFQQEGSVTNTAVTSTKHVGLLFANTSTTGSSYYFDDVIVTGEVAADNIAPELLSAKIVLPNKLLLTFSESVDKSNATFLVSNNLNSPQSVLLQNDKTIELTFDASFEKGTLYNFEINGVSDISGNVMLPLTKKIGLPEQPEAGDIIWNELMFNAPNGGQEYVEVLNISTKLIDLSKIAFATRKTDGSLNTAVTIPPENFIAPDEIVAFAISPDSVLNYHHSTADAHVVATNNWYNLKVVWCDPEAFSPDNDGTNDICFVRYSTEYAGFVANVAVFNPTGVKIADLARNSLLSIDGFLTWDGKTLLGTNAETGIYLLYFEMFHPVSGQKKIFKLPLVVSAR